MRVGTVSYWYLLMSSSDSLNRGTQHTPVWWQSLSILSSFLAAFRIDLPMPGGNMLYLPMLPDGFSIGVAQRFVFVSRSSDLTHLR